mmetsp:Transcript_9825/g.14486  ORF Transcript_9825/g.14486 Transcript_9825/m.14486 type:complete len:234 (+) Transcript_9825:43-744(+)
MRPLTYDQLQLAINDSLDAILIDHAKAEGDDVDDFLKLITVLTFLQKEERVLQALYHHSDGISGLGFIKPWLLEYMDHYEVAGYVHDFLYRKSIPSEFENYSRHDADRLFFLLLTSLGFPFNHTAYLAVRLFGEQFYKVESLNHLQTINDNQYHDDQVDAYLNSCLSQCSSNERKLLHRYLTYDGESRIRDSDVEYIKKAPEVPIPRRFPWFLFASFFAAMSGFLFYRFSIKK